uniref:hypothetical protein n=1 Tax=uncultured Polaribacter sp. TaxID=174711 RepID=UPI002628F70E|nr:hypothetical protein [uncultured Polaribacter sp.]
MKSLLTVKPWIIFISLFILAIFAETIFGHILFILWIILFTYWTLKVGENLYYKLENRSILNLKRFKIQIAFVVIYYAIILVFGGYEITDENINSYGFKAWIIIPLHLILMFFIFHTIYFLSKCIVELRKKNEKVLLYMLGFWFFPIGIWIIQPRIIELIDE